MPLIVLEGIDGCGKTTQVERLIQRLVQSGRTCRRLREPGGTALGEAQRAILLDPKTQACPTAELFGYLQARAQLCHEVIAPAVAAGEVLVMDRFYHSTLAYQGHALGLDLDAVRAAIRLATGGIVPDVVVWLAVDPAEAQRRRAASRGMEDRMEARGLSYQQKVHDGFAAMAAAGELVRIDATQAPDAVAAAVWAAVAAIVG